MSEKQSGFQRRYCRLNVPRSAGVLKLSVVCRRLRLNGMALNQAGKRFGVEDEEE